MKSGAIIGFCLFLLFSTYVHTASVSHIKVFLPGGHTITAELAVTPEQRQRGLMFRDGINFDQGMLFIFESEGRHSFWMKNMKFAIDLLWLDGDKRIIHIEEHAPPCEGEDCPSYAPALPAMYVLELAAGSVARLQLELYQRIDFIVNKDAPIP
jgi:uncharacterized membrane protein (UPF0127 family)